MDSTLKKLYVYSADLIEVDNNKPQDFDLYEIEARSSLETRELSLVVDFINSTFAAQNTQVHLNIIAQTRKPLL